MKCIIYIKTKDIHEWNQYMWNLRSNEPALPPAFRTNLDDYEEAKNEWVQMIIPMDDLQRIYDMMDEYATMVEKFNLKEEKI